jgi:pimeloyl-ACP methyl ester carboxylesterase
VLGERFSEPVLIIGVGLGGEVAAELALTFAHLVEGFVMVDVDFWSQPSFITSLQTLPWLGRAATYTWETGGRYALTNWSPYCDRGGWCPTVEQASVRSVIVEIERTTDSFYAFRRTRDAALAPANLGDISAPGVYVWSTDGRVDETTIDRITEEMPGIEVVESGTFQAHLEDAESVARALTAITGE